MSMTSEIKIKSRATLLSHTEDISPNHAGNGENVSQSDLASSNDVIFLSSFRIRIRLDAAVDLDTGRRMRDLNSRLSKVYKHISRDPRIRKGMPHIKGTRVAVGHVLSHIETLGSINATVKAYDSTINAEQVREAIAYARAFLEEACDPTPPQTTG